MTSCTKPLMGTGLCASMDTDKVDVGIERDDTQGSSGLPQAGAARMAVRKMGGISCGRHISPSVLTAWSMDADRSDCAKLKNLVHLTDRLTQQRIVSSMNLGVAVFLFD